MCTGYITAEQRSLAAQAGKHSTRVPSAAVHCGGSGVSGRPDRSMPLQSCTAQSCQQATIAEASEVWRATGVPCQLRQCGRASRTISADASCRDDKANPRSADPSVVAAIAASQASAISREIGKGMTSPAEPVSATLERIVFRATRSGASACTSLRPCSFSAPPVSTVTDDK